MEWYKNTYFGERARRRRKEIKKRANNNDFLLGVYFITLPMNDANTLEIYPSYVLLQPYFKKRNMYVVGVGTTMEEAKNLTVDILMDCYNKTGQFFVRKMCEESNRFRKT